MMAVVERFWRGGVLMLWGTVICYFYFSGRIDAYLHPSFHWLAISAGVVLVILALLLLLLPFDFLSDGGCEPPRPVSALMKFAGALILVIPLLVTVRVSPSQFGVTTALNRGFINSASQLPMIVNMPDEPLPGVAFGASGGSVMDYLSRNDKGQIITEAMDLLYAAEEPSMRQDFEGREIEIVGQFVPARSNNPGEGRFNLIRFFMLCCAADAQPLSVMVEPLNFETFPDMTWVKVDGVATFPIEGGVRIPVIDKAHVKEISPPPDRFVY